MTTDGVLTKHEIQLLETATRVLHERHTRMGTGHQCDRCRNLVRRVAAVLWNSPGLAPQPRPSWASRWARRFRRR